MESAVVGYDDGLKGETPLAFCVLKGDGNVSSEKLEEIKAGVQAMVRKDVGAFARLNGIIIMDRLPKTRSGKILRGTIKSIVNNVEYKTPSTIEDLDTLTEISDSFNDWKATLKQ